MLEVELESPTTLEVEMNREVVRSNIKIDGEAVDKGFLRYKVSNGAYETVLPDAEVNSISENIVQNKAVHDYVESRISDVEGDIPQKTSELLNDSGFITANDIPDIPSKTSDLTNDGDGTSPFATEDYVDRNGGKIDSISVNGTPQTIDANKNVDITVPTNLTDLNNDGNFVQDADYVHTDNNYTTTEKTKLSGIESGAEVNIIEEIKVNGSAVTPTDKSISITIPTQASDVDALPDSTKYGASIDLTINSTTYVVTAQLKDQDGNNLGQAKTIDLPLESIVVSAQYYATYTYDGTTYTKVIVITLATTSVPVIVPVGDLVSGLQTEITSSNKLSADLIADGETNKAFTATEKSKLSGIENGAEANVQPDWSQTNDTQDDYIKNKPTALSQFTDDATHRLVTDTEKTTWSGKQDAITSSNKLSADNVDDANSTNKFVTTSEKNTWNAKQNALPTTSTAGKVLKSTSTAGVMEWGDESGGSSVVIDDTTGSESISDNTNTINVMTRDTAQTISGSKSFTGAMSVDVNTTSSGDTVEEMLQVGGGLNVIGVQTETTESNQTTTTAGMVGVTYGFPIMQYEEVVTNASTEEEISSASHSVVVDADGVKIDNEVVPTTYQKKTDNSLNTTSKTIVGAINELYADYVSANTTLEGILGV